MLFNSTFVDEKSFSNSPRKILQLQFDTILAKRATICRNNRNALYRDKGVRARSRLTPFSLRKNNDTSRYSFFARKLRKAASFSSAPNQRHACRGRARSLVIVEIKSLRAKLLSIRRALFRDFSQDTLLRGAR